MNQDHLLRRILLIDEPSGDNAPVVQVLGDEIPGLDIQIIPSLDRLNQLIAPLKADLVIICDPLSWITGIELVHLLKARSHCPIIMVAESGNLEVAVTAMKAGLDDYVVQSADDTAPLIHSIRSVWQKVQSQCDLASARQDSARLLQQQIQQNQALNRVVQSIRNSLELSTIFATAAAEVTQLLNVYRTTILHYVPEQSCWHVVACHRLNEALPDVMGLEVPDQGNLFATQIKQFQIVQVDGVAQISDPVNQEIFRQFPGIVWLIIPIVLNGKVWGALSLSKPQQTAPWKPEERELATKVTDQLEIAIQQAQLYQQAQQELLQRQQVEADLQRLNQELEQRVQERTEQLQQEIYLRQQAEETFQRIFQTSPHGIAMASQHDRRIIEANDAYAQILEYSREEMIGQYVDDVIHFANPAEQGKVQKQLMATGHAHNVECTIRTRSGAIRTAIASAEFLEINRVPCMICLVNDITDRQQAEAALQQSEARFQKIAAASPGQIYILVTRPDGSLLRFDYVSPAVLELRELSPEQLLQDPSPIYDQIHPDDRVAYFAMRDRSLATMEPFFHEYRIVTPSGQVKWLRASSRPERQENDEIFWYGIVLDVSDRKQIEEQLRASIKEKEILLREVYHRVKNNMQMVSSLLNLQAASDNDPVVLKLIAETQQRVRTMALIHERLYRSKDLARINATTYVEDLVNNLVRAYTMANSSIQVVLELGDFELDLDTAVPCGLIINELVSNALKYAFPNQQGEIKLQFWAEATGNYYLIVKDNGIGIPPHIHPQHTGSLGMQLIYGLTNQLRGVVELDREGGSQFRIIFRNRK